MSNTRKEKPDWFLLIDKIKAIIEVLELDSPNDLATFVGVAKARPHEWIAGKMEPKAQKVILIQKWVEAREAVIEIQGLGPKYEKALVKARKS